jgi:hypothetical protein
MKAKIMTAVMLGFFVLVGVPLYRGCQPVWQFDRLERNARKVITGDELQAWATNFLVRYPTNDGLSLRVKDLGTNFPNQLLGLAPKLGPHVFIYQGRSDGSPNWVRLYWGSGFLGSTGFEIGPTNFVSRRPGHAWQPGVYFCTK